MKRILYAIGLISLTIVFSCEEDLDVNRNSENPTNVDSKFFLSAAQGSLATNLGGFLGNYGGFMAQYHAQAPSASQYENIEEYNVNTDFTDGFWSEAYAGGIRDLDEVISLSSGNTGDLLIAKILRAYYFQVLTDFYGDIPYSNVLQGSENSNPEVVPQRAIYESLIDSVNQAIADYQNNPVESSFGNQDVFLNSELPQWIAFGNTLLLKLYIRVSNTDLANPAAVNELIATDNFIETNVGFDIYLDEENKRNPFYDVQISNLNDVNNIASNSLLNFLVLNEDERVDAIYRKNVDTLHVGVNQGDFNEVSGRAVNFSRPNVTPTTPVYLITAAESSFLQAEALVRYSGGAGAKIKYDQGVTNSYDLYDLPSGDAKDAVDNLYPFNETGTSEEQIRQIIIQKWVSNAYVNNIESYFEQLRTGYPEIIDSEEVIPNFEEGNLIVSLSSILPSTETPKSMFYPFNEVSRNINVNQKGSLSEAVWWDK